MAEAVTVEQLEAGTHACLTFTDPDERIDLIAAFVGEGLEQGDRVVCFTDTIAPQTLGEELLQRSVAYDEVIATGQLRVADYTTAWLHNGAPSARRMLDILTEELSAAAAAGFTALRVTADMGWATRPHAAAQELLHFERQLGDLAPAGTLTTICQYDRDVFDAVTLAFAAEVHQKTVAAQVYHEDPLLRVCRQYRPPGVRIAGELDYRHLTVLQQALAESIRLDQHIHLDLRRLHYLDGACAAEIIRAATELPPDRHMLVRCGPLVDKLLQLCGAIDVRQLRVSNAP
ncbi:MEDS domain-containing protein [Dactylosporangium roseum]|uniref:MEDS domain-containing protein n=1 Tax=Dactylosporangium roseum TaxID=47989 RepID=A0ABY5ZCG7_9ACTN|nr:MEDS domain-containing protein [Dactylosporangium roseum]UWZ39557.1 MEDS domain-containing protein [Dactylosporangium roseum]